MSDRSFTFTFSGNKSTLSSHFFPPLELSLNKNYVIGLIDLYTYFSIPNVYVGCNKFYVGDYEIIIPDGSYEIDGLTEYLKEELLKKEIQINLEANNSTLRCEITCSADINFNKPNTIRHILGFSKRVLKAYEKHHSDEPIKILKVNSLRVECNIIDGAYINGEKNYAIHEFFPDVAPGYKIVEIPREIIYLPVRTDTIDYIQLRILDQNGDLVDFRGENITIRLHLKNL